MILLCKYRRFLSDYAGAQADLSFRVFVYSQRSFFPERDHFYLYMVIPSFAMAADLDAVRKHFSVITCFPRGDEN